MTSDPHNAANDDRDPSLSQPAVDAEDQADPALSSDGSTDPAGPSRLDEHDPTDDTTEESSNEHSARHDTPSEDTASEDTASEDTAGEDAAGEDTDEEVEPIELLAEEIADADEPETNWYILKVQVNREDSIRDALQRRVKLEGLERYFEQIIVPTEDVAEFTKSGKRRIVKKKLYPGYIMVKMAINDDTWFAVRETPGIGDFTGSAGKPTPMDPRDVERILRTDVDEDEEGGQIKTSIPFAVGDRVRVKEGNFQNFEGEVDKIDEAHGLITVVIPIFNRPTPVEIPYWQIEKV